MEGVQPGWSTPPALPWIPRERSQAEVCQAQKVLKEYLEIGAVKHIPPDKAKFFGALVCNLKDGGAARKVATHFRLQAHKRAFRCQKVQNGPLGKHLPVLKKRHVGGKDRPEKCLLSFGVIPPLTRVSVLRVGQSYYQFQGAASAP